MTRMNLRFETEPLTLRIARKMAAAAASAVGAADFDAQRIELAVGEALSNAYLHAYDQAAGPVELEIAYETHRLVATVHDEGKGLPFEPKFPEPPDPARGNGYGLHVIRELVDEAGIQHPGIKGRGTSLRMAIRLR